MISGEDKGAEWYSTAGLSLAVALVRHLCVPRN